MLNGFKTKGLCISIGVGMAAIFAFSTGASALRSRGGLCVITGGGMEVFEQAVELTESGPWIIHWLNRDADSVRKVRELLLEEGLYGRITVEHWDETHLPYTDNLVNKMVVEDEGWSFDNGELWRVLSPEGSVFKRTTGSGYKRLEKPRPDDMGEWTHPWHDAGGSLSASDRAFDVPNAFQWISGPPFPMGHRKRSAGAQLSAGGRTFQITQNVVENFPGGGPNYLIARDAYNGTVLWSREWKGPLSEKEQFGAHTAIVTCGEKVYGARGKGVSVFDSSTGEELSIWPVEGTPQKLLLADGILVAQSPKGLTAFDAEDGTLIWRREMDEPWGALAADGQVYCLSSSREKDGQWRHELVAMELESGDVAWKQPTKSQGGHRDTKGLRLNFAGEGIVSLIEWDELRFLCAEDGNKLWGHETSATARPFGGGHDSRMAGHFLLDEKVWIRNPSSSKLYKAFDPRSGELIIAFSPDTGYAVRVGDESIEARSRDGGNPKWLHEIPDPAQVEAMLVAENALFIAGPNNRGNPIDDGGFLRIINRENGDQLTELELPAPPVHDGMAAANGRVFVTLKNGSVICLMKK